MAVRIIVNSGKCQGGNHKIGQEFIVEGKTPAGMCLGAWNSIAPYLTTLLYGGSFPWEVDENIIHGACPDIYNQAIFRLIREER